MICERGYCVKGELFLGWDRFESFYKLRRSREEVKVIVDKNGGIVSLGVGGWSAGLDRRFGF